MHVLASGQQMNMGVVRKELLEMQGPSLPSDGWLVVVLVMSDSCDPMDCSPARLLCP